MSRLRTAFASESGLFLFFGVFGVTMLLGTRSLYALAAAVLLGIRLWKRHRRLFWMGLVAGLLLIGRDLLASLPRTNPSELTGIIVDIGDERFELSTKSGKWIVHCFEECVGEIGDRVRVQGEERFLDPKRIDGAFDDETYLRSMGFSGRFRSQGIVVVGRTHHPARVRAAFFAYVDRVFGERSAAWIRYALFGDDSQIDDQTLSWVRRAGVAHLFAISGLHLTLLAGFLHQTWSRMFWHEDRFWILLVSFLFLYNLLTGFSPSLVRASFFSVIQAFPSIKKRLSNTDWLTLIGLAMLLFNPWLICHVGFQLSFLATAGLYLFQDEKPSGWLASLRTSAAVSLLTLPIMLSLQGEVSLWIVVLNVAFGVLVTRVLLPATIMTLFVPPLQGLFSWLANGFFFCLKVVDSINVLVPLTLIGGFWLMYWLALLPFLNRWFQRKAWVRQASMVLAVVVAAQWLTPLTFVPKVSVLDVNQGDAIWIETPQCKMIIDTGDVDDYDTVLEHLLGRGIRDIDALVLTHNHADHYGELTDLTHAIDVKRVYLGSPAPVSFEAASVLVNAGDEIVCGDVALHVLSADRGETNENNNSLVLRGMIGNDDWLFMADAELPVEASIRAMIDESVDILKVGHHGGDTSTGLPLLQSTTPDLAILSVGRPNPYGHPHDAVLTRLEEEGIAIKRTDRDGTVTVWTFGTIRVVETAKQPTDRIWEFFARFSIKR